MEAPLLLPVSTAAYCSTSSSEITVDDDSAAVVPPSSTPASPSGWSILARYLAVILVASVSLFAHHEASKGFRIDVVNAAPRASVAARRFDLLFVANGRAERVLHRASRAVEDALFPDPSFPRRKVTRVTVRLAGGNHTADDVTLEVAADGDYVISLSPRLLSTGTDKPADAVAAAVRRAVARMWLWDGRGAAPSLVTESMVEFLAADHGADEVESPSAVDVEAHDASNTQCISPLFLKHLELRRAGFVARLNRAMRDRWSDAAVDAALGAPARPICAAYLSARVQQPAVGSTPVAHGSTVAAV